MKLINYTAHDIRVRLDACNDPTPLDSDLVYLSQGNARIKQESFDTGTIDGAPLQETRFIAEGLPDPAPETFYIVSSLTALQARVLGRSDLVSPSTGPASGVILTSENKVYAVRAFQYFTH